MKNDNHTLITNDYFLERLPTNYDDVKITDEFESNEEDVWVV